MKKMIALLLIGCLLLSGCALKQEDHAVAVEKTESEISVGTNRPEKLPQSDPLPTEKNPEQKEENQQPIQKPADSKDPAPQESFFTKEDLSRPFDESYEAVKEFSRRQRFSKTQTKEQKRQFYRYLVRENRLYLEAQRQGLIGDFHYAEGKNILNILVYTTDSAVGSRLVQNHYPSTVALDQTVRKFDERIFLRMLSAEPKDASGYLQAVDFDAIFPAGQMRLQLDLGKGYADEAMIQELLAHYLAIDQVIWLELSYAEKKSKFDPTAVHEFWKEPEEISLEQARLIAREKIHKRMDERLSMKERYAFYLLTENYMRSVKRTYSPSLMLATTEKGSSMNPLEAFPFRYDEKAIEGAPVFETEYPSVKAYTKAEKNVHFFITLPSEKGTYHNSEFLSPEPIGKIRIKLNYGTVYPHEIQFRDRDYFSALLRHYWSIDCVTWVELSHIDIHPHLS